MTDEMGEDGQYGTGGEPEPRADKCPKCGRLFSFGSNTVGACFDECVWCKIRVPYGRQVIQNAAPAKEKPKKLGGRPVSETWTEDAKENLKPFAEQLKHFRLKKGVSRRELAEASFLSYSLIRSWEMAVSFPTSDWQRQQLADGLGLTNADIQLFVDLPVAGRKLPQTFRVAFAPELAEEVAAEAEREREEREAWGRGGSKAQAQAVVIPKVPHIRLFAEPEPEPEPAAPAAQEPVPEGLRRVVDIQLGSQVQVVGIERGPAGGSTKVTLVFMGDSVTIRAE